MGKSYVCAGEKRARMLAVLVCAALTSTLAPAARASAQSGSRDAVEPDAIEFFLLGNRADAEGNFAIAISLYSRAIKLQPRYAEAYLNRGRAESESGNIEGAIADYTRAIKLNPRLAEAHNNYASVLLDKGEIDEAAVEADKAVRANSDLAEPYALRGIIRYLKGNPKGAIGDLTRAIALLPRYMADAVHLSLRNPKLAFAYSARALVRDSSGDAAGALSDYDASLKIAPNARTYNNRGNVKVRRSDLRGALADYDLAIKADPEMTAAYFNRGKARLLVGEYEGAISDLTKVIQNGNRVDSRTNLFLFGNERGNQRSGMMYASYMGRGFAREQKGDLTGALADLTQAIATNPGQAQGYANRGRIRCETGELQLALDDLDKAIDIDPKAAMPYLDRGLARLGRGDLTGSDEDFQKCLALDPKLKDLVEHRSRLANRTKSRMSDKR